MSKSLARIPVTQELGADTSPSPDELLAMHAFLGTIPPGIETPAISDVTEHHAASKPGENYQVSERGDQLVIDWHRDSREFETSDSSVVAAGAGIVALKSVFEASKAGAKEAGIHGSIGALVKQIVEDPEAHSLSYSERARLIDEAYRAIPRRVKKEFIEKNNVTGEGYIGRKVNAWGTFHAMAQSAVGSALDEKFAASVERAEKNKGTIVLGGNVSQTTIPKGELTQKLGLDTDYEAVSILRALAGLDEQGISITDATEQSKTAMSVSVSPIKLVRQLIAESSDHEAFLDIALPSLVEIQLAQKQRDTAQQKTILAEEAGLQDDSAEFARIKEDITEADGVVVRASLEVFGIWHDRESAAVHRELQVQLAGAETYVKLTHGTTEAEKADIQQVVLTHTLEQCFGKDGKKAPTVAELRNAKQMISRHIQTTQSEREY